MVAHMKTTLQLSDAVLAEAKELARREHTSLRQIVERALRREIEAAENNRAPFRLADASVDGQGLTREFGDAEWARMRDAVYEGRGAP